MKKNIKLMMALFLAITLGTNGASALSPVKYIKWSWDDTQKVLVKNEEEVTDYEMLRGAPGEWKMLGDNDNPDSPKNKDHYYVVDGNVEYKTLTVFGNAHLIICDGATLTCTGGIKVEHFQNYACLTIYAQNEDVTKQGLINVTNSYNASGIGTAISASTHVGLITIHGGNIDCTGGSGAPGIGGFYWYPMIEHYYPEKSGLYIYGGSVTARGGKGAAGIGGYDDTSGLPITVYGGTVTATGGRRAAGIGNGDSAWDRISLDPSDISIYGGTVTATGGDYGAGIGGGCNSNGGKLYVYGGTVTAKGGKDAAGIGGGEDGQGGQFYMTGGTVYAEGTGGGAGIGGGDYTGRRARSYESSRGADVTILGGTVTAKAGGDCKGRDADSGSAIGCGEGKKDKSGGNAMQLQMPDNYRVTAGDSESDPERVFTAGERVAACRWRNFAKIEACDHTKQNNDDDAVVATYTVNDTHHIRHCLYCATAEAALHNYPDNANCVCGKAYNSLTDTWTVTIDVTTDGKTFVEQDNLVVKGHNYVLPTPQTIKGLVFMGYLETYSQPATGIEMADAEYSSLVDAGMVITPTTNIQYYARYRYDYTPTWTWAADGSSVTCDISINSDTLKNLVISHLEEDTSAYVEATTEADGQRVFDATAKYTSANGIVYQFTDRFVQTLYYTSDIELNDDSNNDELLINTYGRKANVTLKGRTLYVDGSWNTLCLPFDANIDDSPLKYAHVWTLKSSEYSNGTLKLNFTEVLNSIEAGKPYLVRWVPGALSADIVNPVFEGVTINDKYDMVESDHVYFMGNTSPFTLEAGDKTVLYLGADKMLYYPSANVTVGSCRAVFHLKGLTAGDLPTQARAFVLNFGDESTGITTTNFTDSTDKAGEWYDLQGRRLNGQPTTKGIYINNGKVIIK